MNLCAEWGPGELAYHRVHNPNTYHNLISNLFKGVSTVLWQLMVGLKMDGSEKLCNFFLLKHW